MIFHSLEGFITGLSRVPEGFSIVSFDKQTVSTPDPTGATGWSTPVPLEPWLGKDWGKSASNLPWRVVCRYLVTECFVGSLNLQPPLGTPARASQPRSPSLVAESGCCSSHMRARMSTMLCFSRTTPGPASTSLAPRRLSSCIIFGVSCGKCRMCP